MKQPFITHKGITPLRFGIAALLAFLILLASILFLDGRDVDRLKTEYEKSMEKIRLVQTMQSELLASAEAEKSAVMADTDQASHALARQSLQSSQDVEKARLALEALVEKNGEEAASIADFTASWEKLRQIDQEILSLAVQNTNLKALRLSIGPAAAAMSAMREALEKLMDWAAVPQINDAGIIRLAARALADGLTIYSLQTPHIAENTDAGMDGIEAKMTRLDKRARQALIQLETLVREAGKPLLVEAQNSFREFEAINKEIIDLSRQNTNIRSFAGSMGQKRQVMSLCLSRLNALQVVVKENATFKARR